MLKSSIAFTILLFLVIITFVFFGVTFFIRPKFAGVLVKSEPIATLLIDGVEVGKTPYEGKYQPKEIHIKLIPDFQTSMPSYETKVDLINGVKTVISHTFAQTKDLSATEIVSFEQGVGRETGIVVISDPLDADLFIDDIKIGTTPYKSNLSPGEYLITLTKRGYGSRTIPIRVVDGYKLTAWVKLPITLDKNEEISVTRNQVVKDDKDEINSSLLSSQRESENQYVVILDTGTGFLRVRENPSILSEEIGRVIPKKEYELIEVDKRTGWYKIRFENGLEGYVSNKFARLK